MLRPELFSRHIMDIIRDNPGITMERLYLRFIHDDPDVDDVVFSYYMLSLKKLIKLGYIRQSLESDNLRLYMRADLN
jgi:hypothetical protein